MAQSNHDIRHHEEAQQVVEQFKHMLSPTGRVHVSQKHLQELEMLIEVALSKTSRQVREDIAHRLETLVASLHASD